ncbi:DUF916 domain-containing protein [Secundilactobacillus malefermentans]|nr:DUF916 domain-containing protein [Secundilactobacillus malefermentans]
MVSFRNGGNEVQWEKHLTNFTLALISLGLMMILSLRTVQAEDMNGIAVSPIYDETELSQDGYFNLKTKANETVNVAVRVVNQKATTQQLRLSLNAAYTNENGIISYDKGTARSKDQSQFGELVNGPQKKTIRLKSGETKRVSFSLKMPTNSFRGQRMGGIRVVNADNKQKQSIANQYAVAIPIVVRQSNQTLKGSITTSGARYKLQNGKGILQIKTINDQPWVLPKVVVSGQIVRAEDHQVVRKFSQKEIGVAPRSNFDWQVTLDKPLPAGNYQLNYRAVANATDQKWQSTESFKVKANQVTMQDQQKTGLSWVKILIGLFVGLAIATIGWLLFRIKRPR